MEHGEGWRKSDLTFNDCVRTCAHALVRYFLSHHNIEDHLNFQLSSRQVQMVSGRFLTLAARIRVQVSTCGICSGQRGNEAGSIRLIRSPLPILAPHSSSIFRC
jgi:sulfur relay (sulfurtransferase) complex TusBCD TusD component (DsrE family)